MILKILKVNGQESENTDNDTTEQMTMMMTMKTQHHHNGSGYENNYEGNDNGIGGNDSDCHMLLHVPGMVPSMCQKWSTFIVKTILHLYFNPHLALKETEACYYLTRVTQLVNIGRAT